MFYKSWNIKLICAQPNEQILLPTNWKAHVFLCGIFNFKMSAMCPKPGIFYFDLANFVCVPYSMYFHRTSMNLWTFVDNFDVKNLWNHLWKYGKAPRVFVATTFWTVLFDIFWRFFDWNLIDIQNWVYLLLRSFDYLVVLLQWNMIKWFISNNFNKKLCFSESLF